MFSIEAEPGRFADIVETDGNDRVSDEEFANLFKLFCGEEMARELQSTLSTETEPGGSETDGIDTEFVDGNDHMSDEERASLLKLFCGKVEVESADIVATDRIGTEFLYEIDGMRVWIIKLKPGESTGWHIHNNPYMFMNTSAVPGLVRTEYADGTFEVQDRDPIGHVEFRESGPIVERLVNIGSTPYSNSVIEFEDRSLMDLFKLFCGPVEMECEPQS